MRTTYSCVEFLPCQGGLSFFFFFLEGPHLSRLRHLPVAVMRGARILEMQTEALSQESESGTGPEKQVEEALEMRRVPQAAKHQM